MDEKMENFKNCSHLMLLYESPQRLRTTLTELAGELGEDRPAAVLRELTKLHEQVLRGTLRELCAAFDTPPKGECVIAIAGAPRKDEPVSEAELDGLLADAIREGLSTKDAAARVSVRCGMTKKQVYRRALELARDPD